mgnify:FL=1
MSTNNEGTPTPKERMAPVQGYSAGIPWSMHRIHQNERINQMTPAEIKASNLRELEKFRAESSTPPAGAEPHNYATPPMPCTDGEGGPDLTDTLNKIASRAGAEPSPEEAAARAAFNYCLTEERYVGPSEIAGLAYELSRFFAPLRVELAAAKEALLNSLRASKSHDERRDEEMLMGTRREVSLQSDLTEARARIGELENMLAGAKQVSAYWIDQCKKQTVERDDLKHKLTLSRAFQTEEEASLRQQLALANAKAEEARRAGVKCFNESHPDAIG